MTWPEAAVRIVETVGAVVVIYLIYKYYLGE